MTITTSKGLTYDIQWAWSLNLMGKETLMISLVDRRSFSEIAIEFEGCDMIYRNSEEEGDLMFEGFTKLVMLNRPNLISHPEEVEIHLIKEG